VQKTPTQKRNARRARAGTRNWKSKFRIDGDVTLFNPDQKRNQEAEERARKLANRERYYIDDTGEVVRRRRKRLVCVELNPGPGGKGKRNRPRKAAQAASMVPYSLSQVTKRLQALEKDAPHPVDAKDFKVVIPSPINDAYMNLRAKGWKGVRHTRQNSFKTRICQEISVQSSSNTALSAVQTLTPLNLTEAKNFATVFDEARTTDLEYQVFFMTTNASGVPTGAAVVCHGAVAYDPANANAYGSVAATLDALSHAGPMPLSTNLIGGPVLTNNHTKKRVQIPPTVDPGLVTDLLGSNWVAATDTGVIVGYLKPYCEAAGASTQTNVTIFVWYNMEFAFRT
jgi:hypothetical protein